MGNKLVLDKLKWRGGEEGSERFVTRRAGGSIDDKYKKICSTARGREDWRGGAYPRCLPAARMRANRW